jgi:hypothetical protein
MPGLDVTHNNSYITRKAISTYNLERRREYPKKTKGGSTLKDVGVAAPMQN